jgi:TatD DNase family protein
MIPQLAELGCYFSFSGYFLLDRKVKARATFQSIPMDRILVETDAPDQRLPENKDTHPLPVDKDGKTVNHPGNIAAVYAGLAKVLAMPVERLVEQVEENYRRIFG